MTGAIFQLNALGVQDLHLYGESKPDNKAYNFIKQVYKRCENFSSQNILLDFMGEVDFSKKIDVIIPRKADYIYKLYLRIVLPPLQKTSGNYAGWVNSIGHALINTIDLYIGEQLIDRHTGLYMEIMNEITTKQSLNSSDGLMIGKYNHIESLKKNAETETVYEIPIKFWFSENVSSSFPLMSLMFHSIRLSIKLNKFEDLVVYDGNTPPLQVKIKEGKLNCEYLYVSENMRLNETMKTHEFLISQVQSLEESIYSGNTNHKSLLDFNHPSKEIIFALRTKENEDNNDWFNFSIRNTIPSSIVKSVLESTSLFIDGHERIQLIDEFSLRVLNSYRYRNCASNKHIYNMVFCNEPDKWIPNGSLNFSMIDEARLTINIRPEIVGLVKLFVFCRSFNVFTVKNGMGGISFSS